MDTNVLLDVTTLSPHWIRWSEARLAEAERRGPLLINDVIHAELSVNHPSADELDEVVALLRLVHAPISRAALFRAGKAFRSYGARGGTRPGVLPDFFIGAHASVECLPLLTRDPARYRTYFPDIVLVTPP